jgi:hypothetical protein
LTLQNVKELPRLGMKMATLAISRRHALLNYAQLGPIEQVPTFARRSPLISLAGCDVDYLKHGASKCAGLRLNLAARWHGCPRLAAMLPRGGRTRHRGGEQARSNELLDDNASNRQ